MRFSLFSRLRVWILPVAVLFLIGAGCDASADAQFTIPESEQSVRTTPAEPLVLSSTAFADGGRIPEKYTCKGQEFSPPLTFANAPKGTVSLALTMEDLDVAVDHWILFNMTPGTPGLIEGDIPPGFVGSNTNGALGYMGPCPSEGTHTYSFKLYALKEPIYLQDGITMEELLKEMDGKIIQTSELKGTYGN